MSTLPCFLRVWGFIGSTNLVRLGFISPAWRRVLHHYEHRAAHAGMEQVKQEVFSIGSACLPERSGWYAKHSSHGVEGPLLPKHRTDPITLLVLWTDQEVVVRSRRQIRRPIVPGWRALLPPDRWRP